MEIDISSPVDKLNLSVLYDEIKRGPPFIVGKHSDKDVNIDISSYLRANTFDIYRSFVPG